MQPPGSERTGLSAEILHSPLEALQPNASTWYAGIGGSKSDQDSTLKSGNSNVNIENVTGKSGDTRVIGRLSLVLPTSFGQAFAAVDDKVQHYKPRFVP